MKAANAIAAKFQALKQQARASKRWSITAARVTSIS
jgi:hypothetical protein